MAAILNFPLRFTLESAQKNIIEFALSQFKEKWTIPYDTKENLYDAAYNIDRPAAPSNANIIKSENE
jgi:hypothetical protein